MSTEAARLRNEASHYRMLARSIADARTRQALISMALDCEARAKDLVELQIPNPPQG